MAYTYNPALGQFDVTPEENETSAARQGMLARQADEGLSDYDKFVQTKAGGVGLPPDQIAPNPDGTGNYLMTFKPGDSGYDSLMQSGKVQPDANGNITVPSNIFQGLTGSGRTSMWQVLRNPVAFAAFVASAGAAGAYGAGGGAAAGGLSAADTAGLVAMGTDAGLSGAALDSFVASGGTAGSTAAGGGGVGLGAEYTGGSGGGGGGGQVVDPQAVDAAAQTTYDAAANAGIPGYDATLTSGVAGGGAAGSTVAGAGITAATGAASGTALSRIIDGTATAADYLSVGGNVLGPALGVYGANQVSDAYSDVANQYLAIGAPYRARLDATYQPGYNLWDQPGYSGAFDEAARRAATSVSATSGNPWGNPGAMGEISNRVLSGAYLPALANERGQLGQFSGLGLNTAGGAAMTGASGAGAATNAIGYGVGQITNPQPTLADFIKQQQQYKTTYGITP